MVLEWDEEGRIFNTTEDGKRILLSKLDDD